MSIMTDARLRLLEARVAEIERQLAVNGRDDKPGADRGSALSPVDNSKPRAEVQKTRKRSRKAS